MTRSVNDRLQTKTAFANPSTATDTAVVAAITGKSIVVHSVFVVAAGANSVYFKSGSTAITGTSALAANGGFSLAPNEQGWFKTVAGEALNFTTSAAVATGVTITYSEE
jgi:hypothetical protein